jgi:hypothetical protein
MYIYPVFGPSVHQHKFVIISNVQKNQWPNLNSLQNTSVETEEKVEDGVFSLSLVLIMAFGCENFKGL